MKIYLIILILLISNIFCQVPKNNCEDDYEFIDGQCQKCREGTHSGSGYPCMVCQAGTYFMKPNNCGPCGEGLTSLKGGFCFKCPAEATITNDKICQCPINRCLVNISTNPECVVCNPDTNNNTNNSNNNNNKNNYEEKSNSSIIQLGLAMLSFLLIY